MDGMKPDSSIRECMPWFEEPFAEDGTPKKGLRPTAKKLCTVWAARLPLKLRLMILIHCTPTTRS